MGGLFALLGTFAAIKIEFRGAISNLPKSIELIVNLVNLLGLGWKCFVEALLERRRFQLGIIRRV
jgi:hypothetical protein